MNLQDIAKLVRVGTHECNGVTLSVTLATPPSPVENSGICRFVVTNDMHFTECHTNLFDTAIGDGLKQAKEWYKQNTGKAATAVFPVYLYKRGDLDLTTLTEEGNRLIGYILYRKGDVYIADSGNKERREREYFSIAQHFIWLLNNHLTGNGVKFQLSMDNREIDESPVYSGHLEDTEIQEILAKSETLAMRVLFDDPTVKISNIVREYGKNFVRNLSQCDTSLGKKALEYLEMQ
jgi:hypothetical protein